MEEDGDQRWRPFDECRLLILTVLLALSLPGDARAQGEAKTVDLARYCTDEHGPDAFVTRRLTDNARMCTLRAYGGLGLTHHVIDQASLCDPGTTPRVSGESTLDCVPGGGGQAAGTGADGGPGSPTPNAAAETGTDASSDEPGGESGPADAPLTQDPDVDVASMQGTWEVDDTSEISSFMLFPPGVKLTIDVEGDSVTGRHVSGLEEGKIPRASVAQGEILFKGPVDDNGRISARGRVSLISASGARRCPDFGSQEQNWQPIEMNVSEGRIHGTSKLQLYGLDASGSRCCIQGTCAGANYGERGGYWGYSYPWAPPGSRLNFVLKRTARVIEVTFTEAEAPYERLKSLPLEDPFTITVKFDNAPGKDNEAVTLKNKRTGKERQLVADKTEDPVIYRTKEITLKPTKAETCVEGC